MKVLFFWKNFVNKEIVIEMLKEISGVKLEYKLSYKIKIFEEYIWQYMPNITFLHCHTEDGDFNRIKKLTKDIRNRIPNCIIIVTYHPDVDDDYKEKHLHGYSCNLMIPEFPIDKEMLKEIHELHIESTHKKR